VESSLQTRKLKSQSIFTNPLILWFIGFVVLLAVFISFTIPLITKPALFNKLGSISLYSLLQGETVDTKQSKFNTTDTIKIAVEYEKADQGVEVSLLFVRLSTNPKAINGREILSQVTVPLTNSNGVKKYSFPAFERLPGNYEVILQSNSDKIDTLALTIQK
jgi:hypothetical protein